MARDLELALRIRADVNAARSEIRRVGEEVKKLGASGPAAGRGLEQVGQGAQRAEAGARRLSGAAQQLRGILLGLASAVSARELIRAADTYALLGGRLKLVTANSAELAAVEKELFALSQRTRSGYAETVELYARVARNAANLGASQADLLQVTETVNQAIQVSGATAAEAAGGVIQFSQALASGELRGEELRSVMENMPRLAQAIVDGLEQIGAGANLTLGDLRKLAEQGELSSERIFRALLTQADTLGREFSALPRTVGGAMTQLGNDVQRALAQADMQPLIDGIDGVRELLTDSATLEAIQFFGTTFAQSINLALIPLREAGRLLEWLRRQRATAAPLDQVLGAGDPAQMQRRIAGLRRQIDDATAPDALRGSQRSPAELDAMRREILQLERARQAAVRAQPAPPDLTQRPPAPPRRPDTAEADAAADAAEKRADAIAKLVDALREEAQTMGLTAEQTALYRLRQLGASESTVAGAQVLADHIAKLRDQEAAEKAAADAARQRAEETARAQAANRDVLEGLAEELHLITLGARERAQEEATRRLSADATDEQRRAVEALAGALYDQQQAAQETGDQMSEFAVQAAHNMQSAFADLLFDPFSEGLDGMVFGLVQTMRQLASEAASVAIFDAIDAEEKLKNLIGGGGEAAAQQAAAATAAATLAAGGTTTATAITTGAATGSATLTAAGAATAASIVAGASAAAAALTAASAAGAGGGLAAGLFHGGGIVGQAGAHRSLPAIAWAGAPRFHAGGIVGLAADEMPAILRKREEVLTEDDPRHRFNLGSGAAAAPVTVKNINVFDTRVIGDYLATGAGEKTVLNIVSRNKAALGID